MAHRPSMRRTAEDWQDAYDGLNERHRQLQQRLNEREEELKLLRVSQRRATAETARAARAPRSSTNMRQPRGRGQSQVLGQGQKQEEVGQGHAQKEEEEEQEGSVQRQDKGRQTFLAPVASAWTSAAPPDPSMVWGMEHSVQNYVTANALYHANEELRQRLDDAAGFVATLQRELSESRALVTGTQARLEDAAQQIRQLVRERDVAYQKLSTAQLKVEDLERALQTRAMDEERVRFSLETQITELRGRLVIGADSNEQLTRDVRTLLAEVKEKSSLAQSLQSRLALAESALASQRQNNENILVELHSLNRQLVNERKRLLSITREAQLAGLRGADVRDLETRLAESRDAHNTLEREHVRLMGSLVHLTEGALRQAREEVRNDLTDARGAAAHWEETAQLLYRDAAQRTQSHVQCREECEEAKRARDEAEVALRAANAELRVCRTKLDMVWPTHVADTEGLSGEELRNAFTRPMWTRRRTRVRAHSATNDNIGTAGSDADDHIHNDDDNDGDRDLLNDFSAAALHLSGDVSLEEQVRELQEANTALVAEITQLRATIELQRMRLRASDGNVRAAREAGDAIRTSCEHREAAAHAMVRAKMDRVEFLEAQVRSLRGYDVAPNHSLGDIAPGETVFELFLGQIISTETPQGTALRNAFPPVFCSADFLLHETTTTPIVTGLNAFLDTTVAFCVAMDALLLCYLQSRELLVQLHRVRPQDEITGVSPYPHRNPSPHSPHPPEGEEPRQLSLTNMGAHNPSGAVGEDDVLFAERLFETIAEGSVSLWALVQDDAQLRAPRPTLRGHIPLRTPSGHHIASVEFSVTVRVAFSDAFRSMATDAARNWTPPPQQQQQQLSQQQQLPPQLEQLPQQQQLPPQLEQLPQQQQLSSHVPFTPPPVFASTVPSPSPSPLSMSVPLSMTAVPNPPPDVRSASLSGLPRSAPLRLVPAAADFASTTSSSVSLLGTPHRAPGAFTHVPRAAASAASSIRALRVDVSRLRLSPGLGAARLPRLACYYAFAALGRDVRLPAPPTPRCECEYLQEGGAHGTQFLISSVRDLLAATREPLVLFFVDEDAGRGGEGNANSSATGSGDAYWAIAMADWRTALERPGEYAVMDLPLVSPQGTRVDGAEVRVRLLAERVAVSRGPSQAAHEVERVTPQGQSAPMDQSLDVEMMRRQLGE